MGMDPVHAVLAPSEVPLFRELTGIGDTPLEVDFEGWSKLALLGDDRVYLFPRRGREAGLARGAVACEALSGAGVESVPKVLGRWGTDRLPSGPVVAFERRRGRHWDALEDSASLAGVETILRSLGAAIAGWQRLDVARLPAELHIPITSTSPRTPALTAILSGPSAEEVLSALARLVAAPTAWETVWRKVATRIAAMPAVLVHGDICENQLLVDDELRVTTVLDWDTAAVGHPLYDFDFGEWGFGIFKWEAQFARLRCAMWEGYCSIFGDTNLPHAEEVHLCFTLSEAHYWEARARAETLDGWGQRRLARVRGALGPATEAARAALGGAADG